MNILIIGFLAVMSVGFSVIGYYVDPIAWGFCGASVLMLCTTGLLINLERLKTPQIDALDLRRRYPVRRMRLHQYLARD